MQSWWEMHVIITYVHKDKTAYKDITHSVKLG